MAKISCRRLSITFAAVFLASGLLGGCNATGHVPPGQVKNVVNPPPGHGGVPPGQLKKY
jgi:hypothetical protein